MPPHVDLPSLHSPPQSSVTAPMPRIPSDPGPTGSRVRASVDVAPGNVTDVRRPLHVFQRHFCSICRTRPARNCLGALAGCFACCPSPFDGTCFPSPVHSPAMVLTSPVGTYLLVTSLSQVIRSRTLWSIRFGVTLLHILLRRRLMNLITFVVPLSVPSQRWLRIILCIPCP